MSKRYPTLVNGPAVGGENEVARTTVERVIDNWRVVSTLQFQIAATLIGKHKIAEAATDKQWYHIVQGIALIDAHVGEPQE